tara:strand:- start:121974 stop:122387 length:414 start_codon:yes stop_codon:yes gene_type:complete
MFKIIMGIIHTVLLFGTLALTYEYYGNVKPQYELTEAMGHAIYFGVLGVSVLWALGNAVIGAAMGMAAGGILDGIKMGLTIGIGMSLGRLWPYVLVFALGAYLNNAEIWVIVGAILLGLVCFGINSMVMYVWGNRNN